MKTRLPLPFLVAAGLLLPLSRATAGEPTPAATEFFEKEVRPLLAKRCFSCHDDAKTKGGLKLNTRAAVLEGGASGRVVVPGKPDDSLLVQAVRYKSSPRMPPKERLPDAEVAVLAKWVQLGVPWPGAAATATGKFHISDEQRRHWSFQPVKAPPLPAVKDTSWPRTPIDRFVLAKLEERRLTPVGLADKRTLIRRATFDLTGLPPTPEEMEAFLADPSPDAFARVIDRLLASPHYGERWGRYWLDLAHYADTAGETADYPVPDAYRYRNYVIAAFNADKPYDQFLREQLAGDILAAQGPRELYAERIIATGFLAGARRFGFDPRAEKHLTIDDTIDTLGKSVLGLTLACGRCHDHKFDPVSTVDYYALFGILDSTAYPHPGSEKESAASGFVPLLPPAEVAARRNLLLAELAPIDAEIKRLEGQAATLNRDIAQVRTRDPIFLPDLQARLAAVTAAVHEAKGCRARVVARVPIEQAYAVSEGKPHQVRVYRRGDPLDLGEEAPRRFLTILGGERLPDGSTGSGRLQLAEWITNRRNPLTPRVMVNRIWQHHFGEGLVRTPSDFGSRGQAPTHPELLDYLAGRFVESGWSIKAMHRQIMLSRTYQLSSGGLAGEDAADPSNLWLRHYQRRRLDAEAIRDSLLAVSGGLDRTPGGPHPFPAKLQFTQHNPFLADYPTNRRSVYLMTQRIRRHPFLALFDGADPNTSTAGRLTTTVPTQALFFLNSPFVHECAAAFAERLLAEPDGKRRVELAYRLAFGRPASAEEIRAAEAYLQRCTAALAGSGTPAERRESAAWASYARVLFASNEFVYVD